MKIGFVEKKLYKLREEHPIVIPQLDPQSIKEENLSGILFQINKIGIDHIAIGGSIIDPDRMQRFVDVATKEYGFTTTIYLTNSSASFVKGASGKTSVYWMSVLNAENMYFLRDILIMSSATMKRNSIETIPTAYVFDDRGDLKTSNWLTRAMPVPRDKPDISLGIALAAQYLGMRFYIMAGGSGTRLLPPTDHIKLLSESTDLFVIPTSGIMTEKDAKLMFSSGADAIHVGKLMETPKGVDTLAKMVAVSQKFDGKKQA